jgi:hypothetical protein
VVDRLPDNPFERWTDRCVGMNVAVLERMERAVAKVRERLLRATSALKNAGIPFAVCGGNAVTFWVSTVDEGAVRNTREIDLLVYRNDLPSITVALENAAFVADVVYDVVMFRDGADGKPSEAIRLLFAGEKTRSDHSHPAPEITCIPDPANFPVVTLESLVVMKLLSNRDKDRTHLRDLIGVGLVDSSWPAKLPSQLAERLQQILDNPDS